MLFKLFQQLINIKGTKIRFEKLAQPSTMSGLKKKGTDTNTSKEQNKSNVSTHHKTEECVNYDAKNKNLGHNGAYQLAQKIKVESLFLRLLWI